MGEPQKSHSEIVPVITLFIPPQFGHFTTFSLGADVVV